MKYLYRLSILFNGVVLIGLSGSILLNFLLFKEAKKYYFELNETRLDPLGLNYYPANLKTDGQPQNFRVVFFGDSRAFGWVSPDIDGYEFINRGVSSQTSTQSLQRLSSHVGSLKPDVVVIQIGINDLKTVALFPEDREAIVHNSQENIQRIVEESQSIGAIVIITTIFPVGKIPLARRPFWSAEVDRAIKEVNAYIRTLANDQVIVLDAFSGLADQQGTLPQEYQADELHLNDRGYAVLNEALVPLITSLKP